MRKTLISILLPFALLSQDCHANPSLEQSPDKDKLVSRDKESDYLLAYTITSSLILGGIAYYVLTNKKKDPKEDYYDEGF